MVQPKNEHQKPDKPSEQTPLEDEKVKQAAGGITREDLDRIRDKLVDFHKKHRD